MNLGSDSSALKVMRGVLNKVNNSPIEIVHGFKEGYCYLQLSLGGHPQVRPESTIDGHDNYTI